MTFVVHDIPPIGCAPTHHLHPCMENQLIAWINELTSFDISMVVKPSKRAQKSLFDGQHDLMIMAEQANFMDQAEPIVSILETEFFIISRNKHIAEDVYRNKRVAVLKNFDVEIINQYMGEFNRVPVETPHQLVQMFLKDRVDAIAGPGSQLIPLLHSNGHTNPSIVHRWITKIWIYCRLGGCDDQVKRELVAAVKAIPKENIMSLGKRLREMQHNASQ